MVNGIDTDMEAQGNDDDGRNREQSSKLPMFLNKMDLTSRNDAGCFSSTTARVVLSPLGVNFINADNTNNPCLSV